MLVGAEEATQLTWTALCAELRSPDCHSWELGSLLGFGFLVALGGWLYAWGYVWVWILD